MQIFKNQRQIKLGPYFSGKKLVLTFILHILEPISFSLQVRVFYAVRLFLGLLSVITETVLVVALSRKHGKRLASYTLAMLCLTSGCFFASTSGWPFSIMSPLFLKILLAFSNFAFVLCLSDVLYFSIWSSILIIWIFSCSILL